MRRQFIWIWLGLTVLLLTFHVTVGRRWRSHDIAAAHATAGDAAAGQNDWPQAEAEYRAALDALDAVAVDPDARYRVRLSLEHARIRTGHISNARDQLNSLRTEVMTDPKADQRLLQDVCTEVATANYHAAWLLRKAGAPPDDWMPLADSARQDFRRLAESTEPSSQTNADLHQKNLETVLNFARIDQSTFDTQPLPDPALGLKQDLLMQNSPPEPPSPSNPSSGDSRNTMNLSSNKANVSGEGKKHRGS